MLLRKSLIVLNNILARCSEEQCAEIVKLNFTPKLIEFINSNDSEIQEQAIWILDNIAISDDDTRLDVIEAGVMPAILRVISS